MNRKETLDRAAECVLKDRQATHGPPEDSFATISKFWSTYLGIEIKDYQVAVMMGLLKIARLKFKPDSEDNHVDLAGYAACSAELATKSSEMNEFRKSAQRFVDDVIPKSFWDGIGSPSPLPATILDKVESCANL